MKKHLLLLVFILSSYNLSAQNLIVNGDFGTFDAAIFSPAPLGYTSFYAQVPYNGTINSVAGGKYAITNEPRQLNTTAFISTKDHTTADGAGNMMFVDGKFNTVFWKSDPIIIQAGVTYIFTYYIKNISVNPLSGSPKNKVDFVGCTNCTAQTTLAFTTNEWKKVQYSINPIVTQSISIELSSLVNVAGDNFVIDDISLTPPLVPMTASFVSKNPSCPNVDDGFIVAYPNSGIPTYTFNLTGSKIDSNSTGIFTGLGPGSYQVSVVDSDIATVPITSTTITLVAPSDMTLASSAAGCVAPSSSVTLTAANGGGTYNWSASTGVVIPSTASSVNVTPAVNTTYTVTSSRAVPNTNLVTNGDFESGTSGFFSDYVYTATSASLTQFDYGITTNPNLWNATFISSTDRSGTGKMLVAKGATTANKTIWSQTVLVDNSKAYTFEFYVQNAVAASPAQFRVLINGVQIVISPLAATNGASAGWTRISGTWNSGLSSTAKIQIIDTNIALAGNDFAIDDISFSTLISKSCNLSAQVITKVEVNPITNFSYQTPICKSGTNPKPSIATGFLMGGTYSESTGLLSINSTTGEINLAASPSGTFTIKYSVDANLDVCQLAGFSTFNITIDSTLPPPLVITPIDYCINTSASALTATVLVGASLNWYGKNATGGVASTTPVIPETTLLGSDTYYVSQSIGACESLRSAITVRVSESITPAFSGIPNSICSNSTSFTLPITSNNGIRGSWTPELINNTTTTTYIFTPDSGQCSTTKSVTIDVNTNEVPIFNEISQICSGDFLPSLPTTSINGITGVWSPALNNLATTTYTFIPTSGQCAINASIEIVVNPKKIPTFSPVNPICSGDILSPLPTNSLNGITGTWSPALNNTATTIYTFTPSSNQCSTTSNLTINVTPISIPTFTVVNSYCRGSLIPDLPTTSNNGIIGTWSPNINNTTTTIYTFIPNVGQCSLTTTLTLNINSIETPSFIPIDPICAGAILEPLSTTSVNGISGTWSPALNNTLTTEYSFTPNLGQCGTPVKLTITVIPNTTPIFDPISPICSGDFLSPLPNISINGITGFWSPILDNTITKTYNFTPSSGQCATSQTVTILVNSIPEFSISGVCDGTDFVLSSSQENNSDNLTYSWYNALNEKIGSSPSVKITQKGNYTVEVEDGKCKTSKDIEVNSIFCEIPKGISPNNDQRNDSFDLRNLTVNKLEIFDRYGVKVYSKLNYQNEWDGTSDKGQKLPDGTYYYVVEFKSGKSKTGWVYLNREN
jgi:gliding motility-associated-like protein